MTEDALDIDAALTGRQTLHAAGVQQLFGRIARLHRRVGEVDEGKARRGDRSRSSKARRSVEVKRVHQDPEARDARPPRRFCHRRAEIGNHCPRKELEHRAQSILRSQVADRGEPVREPAEIGVVRRRNHVPGAQLRASRRKGLERRESVSGVILTNSISSTAIPVAAIAAFVARINGLSSISG